MRQAGPKPGHGQPLRAQEALTTMKRLTTMPESGTALKRCVLCQRQGADPASVRSEREARERGVRLEVPVHFGTLERVCLECLPGYDAAWRMLRRLADAFEVERIERERNVGGAS